MRAPDPLRIVFITAITAAICIKSLYWVKGDELRNPPPVSGIGELSGLIVDAADQPVAHASVRARARGIDHVWSGRTGADGRFRIISLPAGSFTISALKDGFVEAYFGETTWQVGQRSISVDEKDPAQDVRIVMARAGSIGGIVYDEHGQPAPGRFMRLLRRTNGARAEMVTQGWPVRGTDPHGRYRFENLAPGTYYVMAAFDSAVLARVYHPNVSRVAEAKPITLGLGEDREGVDLRYRPIPSSPVAGTIVRADGGPLENVMVRLARAGGLDPDDRNLHRRIGRAGRFDFASVPAGAYWVMAHGTAPAADAQGGSPAQRFWGFAEINVDGRQPLATTLEMTPGIDISGRVEMHAVNGDEPVDRAKVAIVLWGADARTDALVSIEPLRSAVAPNGSFVISGVPAGRFMVQAWRQPWMLASAVDSDGRQLDQPFEVTRSADVRDVTITLSDRPGGISGLVLDDQGQPLGDQQLLIFAADSRLWYPSAMRSQLARSSADGSFAVTGLVAGEYLVAAVEDMHRESWFDRARFERARANAARVTLAAGQRVVQDLRIPTRIRRP